MVDFDFSTFPTLATARLNLRKIMPGDAADLFSLHSDPVVFQYDSNQPFQELSEAVRLVERIDQDFAARQGITWGIAIKGEERVVGQAAFYFQGDFQVFLAYRVARPYWGRGIATEAGRALLLFGFDTLGLHRMNVDIWSENAASVRVVEKLGFRKEGERRDAMRKKDGAYTGLEFWGMMEDEYRLGAGREPLML